jgi:hypothetical protein
LSKLETWENQSGYTKLIKIIKAEVIDIQAVIKTGAVEQNFKSRS